ncbi:hypothetical protein [Clostridium sp.]|uniref:hypothetical protein n=1 Tax=Clostridium sp. TaxID=1506 RepID=UPI00321665EA
MKKSMKIFSVVALITILSGTVVYANSSMVYKNDNNIPSSVEKLQKQIDNLDKEMEKSMKDYGIMVDNTKDPNAEPKSYDQLTKEQKDTLTKQLVKSYDLRLDYLKAQFDAGLMTKEIYEEDKASTEYLKGKATLTDNEINELDSLSEVLVNAESKVINELVKIGVLDKETVENQLFDTEKYIEKLTAEQKSSMAQVLDEHKAAKLDYLNKEIQLGLKNK